MLQVTYRRLLLAATLHLFASIALAGPDPFPQPDLAAHTFEPSSPSQLPNVIGISKSGNVYVGGFFSTIDGQPRTRIARFRPDGSLDPWAPTVSTGIGEPSLAVEDSAGNVAVIFDRPISPSRLLYIPASTQTAVEIDTEPRTTGRGYTKLAFDDAGALFALVSRPCNSVEAAQDPLVRRFTGTTLDAGFSVSVRPAGPSSCLGSAAIEGDKLYIGGQFVPGLVRVSTSTGAVDTAWKPFESVFVENMVVGPDALYVAGRQPGVFEVRRVAKTGAGAVEAGWSVKMGGWLKAMALDAAGGHLYLSSYFADNGELAAFSTLSGALVAPWDPGPRPANPIGVDRIVDHLVVVGDRLFVGGRFVAMGVTPRLRVAAVPLATAPVDWPLIRIAPTSLDFGRTFGTAPRSRDLTISNVGTRDLVVQGAHFYLPPPFSQTHTCTSVPPGGSCTMTVTAALAPYVDYPAQGFVTAMTVISNGSGTPRTVSLFSADGGKAYTVETADGAQLLSFPPTVVGSSRTSQATITNRQAQPLEIEDVRLIAGDPTHAPDYAMSHDCPAVLPVGATCHATVTFKPVDVRRFVWPLFLRVAASASGGALWVDGRGLSAAGDADSDGLPNAVEVALGRNPLVKDNDVFADPLLFAMQQYRDFLGRAPEDGGAAFWASRLASGSMTREGLAAEFLGSGEFEAKVAPVARLYLAYFLRVPDYGGLDFWLGRHRAGDSIDTISNAFAASAEFAGRYGSLGDAQFVDRVYRNVLGRAPDATGQAFWTEKLAAMSRGELMIAFSESAEYRALTTNEVFVTMAYAGMLRRAPDEAGFAAWVGFLDAGNSREAMIRAILESAEYRNRFIQ